MKRDADRVLGHMQHYRTREGRVIRLARYAPAPVELPPPYRHTLRDHLRDVVTILAPYAVAAIWLVAFWLYFAIASASQVPPR